MNITDNSLKNIGTALPSISGEKGNTQAPKSGDALSFTDMVQKAITQINREKLQADEQVRALASGEEIGLAETMVAVAKADISFNLMLQVRNKAISAYQEMLRLQF